MDPINILYIVLLVCASALCIALIVYLQRITRSFGSLENEIKGVADQTKPLIASINSFSEKLNGIADDAKDQVDVVKDIISDVKEHADKILELAGGDHGRKRWSAHRDGGSPGRRAGGPGRRRGAAGNRPEKRVMPSEVPVSHTEGRREGDTADVYTAPVVCEFSRSHGACRCP